MPDSVSTIIKGVSQNQVKVPMSDMNTPVVQNITGGNVDWMKRIRNENMATAPRTINREQQNVIMKLEEALNILREIEIKNEDSFAIINEPLDDFLSNLKYLPTDPPFDFLPTEIKTDIFSYLCDSGAFVAASVCPEWKDVMATRLKKVDEVKIGVHCTNKYECEDMGCCMPEEVLKASIALKSDIPLSLCHHLPNVDSKLIAEGLASASSLSIKGRCECRGILEDDDDGDGDGDNDDSILTRKQFKALFKALDRKSHVMDSLKLIDLDLTWLNQNKLTNFLLSVTRSLTLDEGEFGKMLNVETFVRKLSQVSEDSHELRNLKIYNLDYSDVSTNRMADALCNVLTVHLFPEFPLLNGIVERLIENILTRPTAIRVLGVYGFTDWRSLVDEDDLKSMVEKMWVVHLQGVFDEDQVEAVSCLPGVEASSYRIVKMPITEPEVADVNPTEEQEEDGDGVEGAAKDGVEDEAEEEVEVESDEQPN